MHGDHFFGLVGFLSSLHLLGRTKPIHIYGPAPLKDVLRVTLKASQSYLGFEWHFNSLDFKQQRVIFEDNLIEVSSFPVKHRIECCGFLIREKERERGMIREKISEYGISVEAIPKIKKGDNLVLADGTIIPNSELTRDPMPPRSYAYSADTAYSERVVESVKGVDVLYHEATFASSLVQRAKDTFHSTTIQAAEVAKKAGVGKLVVGHFSARYTDLDIYDEEIGPIFSDYVLAEDGMVLKVESTNRLPQ